MEDELDEIASGERPRRSRGCAASTSATARTTRACRRWCPSSCDDIDARAINTIPIGVGRRAASRSWPRVGPLRPVRPAGRRQPPRSPTTSPPTSSPSSKADRAARGRPRGDRVLGTDPETGLDRDGPHRPLRPLRAARRPRRARTRQAPDGVAVPDHDPRHDHPRRGAAAADPAPGGGRATPPTARRSPPRTGATGPYLKKGRRRRSLERRGAAVHRHPRRGAGAAGPAQARPGPGQRQAAAAGAGRRPRHRASRWC